MLDSTCGAQEEFHKEDTTEAVFKDNSLFSVQIRVREADANRLTNNSLACLETQHFGRAGAQDAERSEAR